MNENNANTEILKLLNVNENNANTEILKLLNSILHDNFMKIKKCSVCPKY